jgi:hypothetical protein
MRHTDGALLGVALCCTLFAFGAGVFYAVHEYIWTAGFLALVVMTWATTRYRSHH